MDTFVSRTLSNQSSSRLHRKKLNQRSSRSGEKLSFESQLSTPECSTKRARFKPLTIEEYESSFRTNSTDVELIDRIFYGSLSCNQLRAALWPYIFGVVAHRGKFEIVTSSDGKEAYQFVDHIGNESRWEELEKLYLSYQAQWEAILPDQEVRFSTFRERKSVIERDVIRCDRSHPFYAENRQNLDTLTNLLMTYMMYDFDIGYVQGMSDLAGPILYMYKGNLVKAFWVFVEVMKLLRRNFEFTQKTIHFQLKCLHKLIKNTDPIFAQYLEDHDTSNCFFAFRAIVCQFKRELMKDEEYDYRKVFTLWDRIWCAERRITLHDEYKALNQVDSKLLKSMKNIKISDDADYPVLEQPAHNNDNTFYIPFDSSQSDTPRYCLTETETFVLALCLSMILRERDIILANNLDSTEIHLHFIDPKLSNDLDRFIEHGISMYSYLKNDIDLTKLTAPKEKSKKIEIADDILKDFLIING